MRKLFLLEPCMRNRRTIGDLIITCCCSQHDKIVPLFNQRTIKIMRSFFQKNAFRRLLRCVISGCKISRYFPELNLLKVLPSYMQNALVHVSSICFPSLLNYVTTYCR